MSDLFDQLTEIRGIGETKAKTIIEVVGEHDTDAPDDPKLNKAIAEANDGNDRKAAIFLRRYSRGDK